jgi:hypothetical protein
LACAGVVVVGVVVVVVGVLVVAGVLVVTGAVVTGVVVTGVVATVLVVAALVVALVLVVAVVAVVAGGVAVVAVVVAAAAHVPGLFTVSWMNVTSALRARSLPSTVMLSVSVICVSARIVPTNVLPEFWRKAELTFQKTLQGLAPLMKLTEPPAATVRSLPARKMKTEFGSPPPSRVTEPVISIDELAS